MDGRNEYVSSPAWSLKFEHEWVDLNSETYLFWSSLQLVYFGSVINFDIDGSSYCWFFADYGVSSYDIGTGFGHFAIASQDVRVSHFSKFNCLY